MLSFEKKEIKALFIEPSGQSAEKRIEIRTHPITGRTCRITLSRIAETEKGTNILPSPPPEDKKTETCPFCFPQVRMKTPRCLPGLDPSGHLVYGESRLFPNLFPYGMYSAVSLFDNVHFVEIGTASLSSYTDCFINCRNYLRRVFHHDSKAIHMAITQNHLPSAGGSLIHPHLQINADRISGNHHRFLKEKADHYYQETGHFLFSDYLQSEKEAGSRYIGNTGSWEWMAAYAPEGFFEIWGILPEAASLQAIEPLVWKDLAQGVLNVQKFYRSLCRNGYNLGILSVEVPSSRLELRVVMMVRSNYAPWVRNDHTGFELMLGAMATFTLPEEIAARACPFWTAG